MKAYHLAALFSALHSFSRSTALAAEDPQITQAPTPTLERRDPVAGGSGTPILSTLKYAFTDLPEQVYPFPVLRGPQFGYNICNSTTLGDNSNCQTLIFNGPDDFCLWGSPTPQSTIGEVEARVVAYCTKPYHGTRVIPPGAITGLQWMKTSAYIQVTGFIANSALLLTSDDGGGELDPHGADLQGNPLGGVVYSNGTTDSDGHTLTQVSNWNLFVGGGQFCAKICYNSVTSPDYCQNIYDLIGCGYNMPSNAVDKEFTSCEGDLQDEAGIYTSNGQVLTYTMPATLLVPPPYQPRVPSSSNCQTFQSTDLLLAATTATSAASSPTASGVTAITSGSSSGAATTKASTGTSSVSPTETKTSGALSIRAPAALALALGSVAAFLL